MTFPMRVFEVLDRPAGCGADACPTFRWPVQSRPRDDIAPGSTNLEGSAPFERGQGRKRQESSEERNPRRIGPEPARATRVVLRSGSLIESPSAAARQRA